MGGKASHTLPLHVCQALAMFVLQGHMTASARPLLKLKTVVI
jgi:hypothetical protein